jgi:hypothetical protein
LRCLRYARLSADSGLFSRAFCEFTPLADAAVERVTAYSFGTERDRAFNEGARAVAAAIRNMHQEEGR